MQADLLIRSARVADGDRTPLMPHVRNEGAGVLGAIEEFARVAEHAGTPLRLSHLKLVGSPALLEDLLHLVEDAAQRVDLTFGQYPYGTGSSDVGKTVQQIAGEQDADPAVAVLNLLGSDGIFSTHPHPRLFGTAARVLGRLALREGVITRPHPGCAGPGWRTHRIPRRQDHRSAAGNRHQSTARSEGAAERSTL